MPTLEKARSLWYIQIYLFCLLWHIPVRAKIISFILLQCDHYAPVMTVHSGTKRTATHHRPFFTSAQLQQWVCDTPPHEVPSSMRWCSRNIKSESEKDSTRIYVTNHMLYFFFVILSLWHSIKLFLFSERLRELL